MPIEFEQPMLKRRRTRIVATVGPASSDTATLEALIRTGVDVFRLNMSHGDHAGHRVAHAAIRKAALACGSEVAVLADLCGPKIRCGLFEGGSIELETGGTVVVTTRDVTGRAGLIPSQYEALHLDARPGARILLDDGNLELKVETIEGSELSCRVVQGGTLKNRKGMNLPDIEVSAPSLTDKDREDARFALDLGVDFLALSFVRRRSDIDALRSLMDAQGDARAAIIAKIERPEALREIEGILEAADGIMVARGDLGVELPAESVPMIQSRLIDLARECGKPVIVATQMLESMIDNPRPTRAEVSDVSTAVLAGADAVMLSAETASGGFPVRAVETMDRVARKAEAYLWHQGAFGTIRPPRQAAPPLPLSEAVTRAAAQLSADLWARAIFVVSETGFSARMVAAARPAAPLIAVSPDPAAVRRMRLLWGVVPLHADADALADREALARRLALELELASPGERILAVAGFHPEPARSAPSIAVLAV
jgi:pyruvate kinase